MEKKKRTKNSGFTDILNIQGIPVPEIDNELDKLLKKGMKSQQPILPGASMSIFGDKIPYATTYVTVNFDNEDDLRTCVRLLRWSDQRLIEMESTISWAWKETVREGMQIRFGVNWYDKDFFEAKAHSFKDSKHLSYFKMFGKNAKDMNMYTEINLK